MELPNFSIFTYFSFSLFWCSIDATTDQWSIQLELMFVSIDSCWCNFHQKNFTSVSFLFYSFLNINVYVYTYTSQMSWLQTKQPTNAYAQKINKKALNFSRRMGFIWRRKKKKKMYKSRSKTNKRSGRLTTHHPPIESPERNKWTFSSPRPSFLFMSFEKFCVLFHA